MPYRTGKMWVTCHIQTMKSNSKILQLNARGDRLLKLMKEFMKGKIEAKGGRDKSV